MDAGTSLLLRLSPFHLPFDLLANVDYCSHFQSMGRVRVCTTPDQTDRFEFYKLHTSSMSSLTATARPTRVCVSANSVWYSAPTGAPAPEVKSSRVAACSRQAQATKYTRAVESERVTAVDVEARVCVRVKGSVGGGDEEAGVGL